MRTTDEQIAEWREAIQATGQIDPWRAARIVDAVVSERARADRLKYGPDCPRTSCLRMAGLAGSLWKSRRYWQENALYGALLVDQGTDHVVELREWAAWFAAERDEWKDRFAW